MSMLCIIFFISLVSSPLRLRLVNFSLPFLFDVAFIFSGSISGARVVGIETDGATYIDIASDSS